MKEEMSQKYFVDFGTTYGTRIVWTNDLVKKIKDSDIKGINTYSSLSVLERFGTGQDFIEKDFLSFLEKRFKVKKFLSFEPLSNDSVIPFDDLEVLELNLSLHQSLVRENIEVIKSMKKLKILKINFSHVMGIGDDKFDLIKECVTDLVKMDGLINLTIMCIGVLVTSRNSDFILEVPKNSELENLSLVCQTEHEDDELGQDGIEVFIRNESLKNVLLRCSGTTKIYHDSKIKKSFDVANPFVLHTLDDDINYTEKINMKDSTLEKMFNYCFELLCTNVKLDEENNTIELDCYAEMISCLECNKHLFRTLRKISQELTLHLHLSGCNENNTSHEKINVMMDSIQSVNDQKRTCNFILEIEGDGLFKKRYTSF